MLEIRLSHGYTLCVPDNLALMTPYVLLEQEAWFEDEVDVLPKLAPEGSVLVDVGANHGVYTLALACRAASHGGRVLAYEPNPELHAGLRASLELNGLRRFVNLKSEGLSREAGQARFHIPLNPELASLSPVHGAKEVDVQLTTLNDVAASLAPGERIGLMKLDAEGAELDILAGADTVLREHQPVVMFEIKHGSEMNHGLAEAFIERGYGLFRVLPGFGLLAPWAPGEPIDGYQLNLIACTATEALRLQQNGLLLTSEQLEAPAPDENIDAAVLRTQLHADATQLPADLLILGMHLAQALNERNDAATRYAHAHTARRGLQSRLVENTLTPEWRLALARLNQMLGERAAALADIQAVLLQLSEVQSPQILVSPHPAFDRQPAGPDRLGWLRTALHESRVRLLRYSGYFGVDVNPLKAIHAMPEHTLEMDRRLALAMLRAGKKITILPESALCSDRHLNAAVWQQIAQGNYRVEVPGKETTEAAPAPTPAAIKTSPSFVEWLRAQTGSPMTSDLLGVMDIGAMLLDNDRKEYQPLLDAGIARVIGFEPVEEECLKLNGKMQGKSVSFLPYFVGDGRRQQFRLNRASMTSSLYESNKPLMQMFSNLWGLCETVERFDVDTTRLDDIKEVDFPVDFIKIDIQGAELQALEGGQRILKDTTVIQTEVEWVPLYENQPLFSEVEQFLRKQGFVLHKILGFGTRPFKPIEGNTGPQALWSDVVFIKDFTKLDLLSERQLINYALLMHVVYKSYDLVHLLLKRYGDSVGMPKLAQSYLSSWMK